MTLEPQLPDTVKLFSNIKTPRTRFIKLLRKGFEILRSSGTSITNRWIKRIKPSLDKAVFTVTEFLFFYPSERAIFLKNHGYPLNLRHPRSFTEKLTWKKIYDRNPLLPIITDKFLVREYVRGKLGADEANNFLVPLLFYGKDPRDIPFDTLPDQFVIKPNHLSGRIILVRDSSQVDRNEIIATCNTWLSETHFFFRHEWAYRKIKPMILVEPLLLESNGNTTSEIKFHCFHGKCRRIVVITGRFVDLQQSGFDENRNYSTVTTGYPPGPNLPRPANLPEMLRVAQKLAEDFDHVRVDFYLHKDAFLFNELTSYTNSGDLRISPTEFDFELGANWTITPRYWKHKPGK